MAREWGMAPWLLADAPQAWVTRWLALHNAEQTAGAAPDKWRDSLV